MNLNKTISLLIVCCAVVWGFALYLRHTDSEPQPGVEHRETNIYPEAYTDKKNYPYYRYDSICFTDGSVAVQKSGMAPMNMEGVIKDKDNRIIAVCSGGSEVVPLYQLPRYNRKGRMTELLEFRSDHNDSTEVAMHWYAPDTGDPDMIRFRQQMGNLTMDELDKEYTTLYRFDYNGKGQVTRVKTSAGKELIPDEGHYFSVSLEPAQDFWSSDISGSSHELVVKQLPMDKNTGTYTYQRYKGMQMLYDICWLGGDIESMHFNGYNGHGGIGLVETVQATHKADTTVYTHSYHNRYAYMQVYWHDGRQVKVEKYDDTGEMEEEYRYAYTGGDIVNLSHLVYDTETGALKERTEKQMKVWKDLFDHGEKPGMSYAEKAFANYAYDF